MTKKIENSLGDLKDKVTPASEWVYPPKEEYKSKKGGFKIKDKVVNASDLAFPSISKTNIEKYTYTDGEKSIFDAEKIEKRIAMLKVFEEIEDYCSLNNLMPVDLIAFHREHSKSILKRKLKPVDGKEPILKESKHLNWRENLTKKKTGQNET